MSSAEDLIAAGCPRDALALLQKQVREHAGDVKPRIFLFQLLCVLGQWPRALAQLEVCGELDAATLPMVNLYRDALKAEGARDDVFAGLKAPTMFGAAQGWSGGLAEALHAESRGDSASAARLRDLAFDTAPATPGSIDGVDFDWIADADSRLGPVLEAVIDGRYGWVPFASLARVVIDAPADLRDLVWLPAHLEFAGGNEPKFALLPARYVGSAEHEDGALQLARRTEWIEFAPERYRGLGQRLLATSACEAGLLDAREIVLHAGSPD